MIGENRQLVTDEPVEFEKSPIEVQDCKKIPDHSRGIYRIYPNSIKENPKDVNMEPVGLGNTRILTGCAQKSPQSLRRSLHEFLGAGDESWGWWVNGSAPDAFFLPACLLGSFIVGGGSFVFHQPFYSRKLGWSKSQKSLLPAACCHTSCVVSQKFAAPPADPVVKLPTSVYRRERERERDRVRVFEL